MFYLGEASKNFTSKISKCIVVAEEEKQNIETEDIRTKPVSILICVIFTVTLSLAALIIWKSVWVTVQKVVLSEL